MLKNKIKEFFRNRNKRAAAREKRKISANKSFVGMLVPRTIVGLIVFLIVVITIRQYMLEEKTKDLDEKYEKINASFMNVDGFGGISEYYVDSMSITKWLSSLDITSRALTSGLQDEFGNIKRDTCYWAVYDLDENKVLKDFSKEHWVVQGYYKSGKELSTVMFDVADEQIQLCKNVLSKPYVIIYSAYFYNNHIYIDRYSDNNGYTERETYYSTENFSGQLSAYMSQIGAHRVVFDEYYYDENNFFRESGLSIASDSGYTLAVSRPQCINECNCSPKFINQSYKWLLNINSDNDKRYDNYKVKHKYGFLSERAIYASQVTSYAGIKYGMVWSVVKKADARIFFFYVGVALLTIAAVVLIITSVAYRKYKISHEIYMYRKALTNAMAHDLKSPLAAISGYAENMNAGSNPEKNDYYAEQIMNRTEYMNDLIEKILELSKTEELTARSKDELEMVGTAEKIFAAFSEEMEKRSLKYQVNGSAVVICDEVSMYTAIKNIIENAVKYCDDNGTIELELSDSKLVFKNPYEEADGLDADKLVEAYVKGDDARSGAKGNGLGLAIVKNICDAHGFSLKVEAKEGEFKVTINL